MGKVLEYFGAGVKTLTVPERATITNRGAELGATTSISPSDETTRAYLKAQKREKDWALLDPDPDARYDGVWEIGLSSLEPLIAQPHSPDRVVSVKEVEGLRLNQVEIGSCTNSSYRDMMTVASILKGKVVAPNVSLAISPGSRQVLKMLASTGALADLIESGAGFWKRLAVRVSVWGRCLPLMAFRCGPSIAILKAARAA